MNKRQTKKLLNNLNKEFDEFQKKELELFNVRIHKGLEKIKKRFYRKVKFFNSESKSSTHQRGKDGK